MPLEIEKKFRILNDSWRQSVVGVRHIRQAYLARNDRLSLRIRVISGASALLTMKTVGSGPTRHEYEYPIPLQDAEELIELRQGAIITKTRHLVPQGGLTWEVDVFGGENAGLSIAEIELPDVHHAFERPDWIGEDVTHDRRFYNAELTRNPFAAWTK